MTDTNERWQFSLRAIGVIVTVAAMVCAVSTSVQGGATFLLGCVLAALFAPVTTWVLAAVLRRSHPLAARRTCVGGAVLCLLAVTVLMADGGGFAVAARIVLFGVWLPQALFIGFFEWCEYEERTVRKQQMKGE